MSSDDMLHATHAALVQMTADRDRLYAIVDRLPKTRDGVPVVPGMDLHRRMMDIDGNEIEPQQWGVDVVARRASGECNPESCYSTRKAAEVARDKDQTNAT